MAVRPMPCGSPIEAQPWCQPLVPPPPAPPRAPPTCDVTVRRGFSSADSSLGISFITMATALSADLAPFPYNSETNKGLVSARGAGGLQPASPRALKHRREMASGVLAGCWGSRCPSGEVTRGARGVDASGSSACN